MKNVIFKQVDGIKLKLGGYLIILSLIGFSFMPFYSSNAQDAGDIGDLAKIGLEIGEAIDSSCDKKRPEGGFKACKGGTCAPAKCISFRQRCESADDCA